MNRPSPWRRRLAASAVFALAVAALAAVSALVIRFAPPWLVSTSGLTGSARLEELSRVRIALLVLVIGALAAGVALYLFRSAVRERRDENRERELTERFMRAVDQIGHPALDVRLGGIYSLERLARESPENHGPVIEILAAFVREHAPWPARNGNGRRRPATDVQAAVTIIGRRVVDYDTGAPISLPFTALAGATLTGAHLELATLSGANLEGADLFKAHLNAADLEGANLRNAGLLLASLNDTVLWGANVQGARLYGASLEGAALKGANLKGAGLTGANLKDAGLHSADLTGADLTGANLEGAGLEGAKLEGANMQGSNLRGAVLLNALYDEATIWPGGLDPAALGAVRRAWPEEPAPPEPAPAWPQGAVSPEPTAAWPEPTYPLVEEPAPPRTVGWPHEEHNASAPHAEPPPEAPAAGREWAPTPAPGWPPQTQAAPQTYSTWTPAPGGQATHTAGDSESESGEPLPAPGEVSPEEAVGVHDESSPESEALDEPESAWGRDGEGKNQPGRPGAQ
ncbi:MAG TPA: pentapeptide repeat-containing protein [Solirubrobacteraceae bacterium]|nr:pentapeptide repeat-containing protein [Solirubrobacteraceae bacterium]